MFAFDFRWGEMNPLLTQEMRRSCAEAALRVLGSTGGFCERQQLDFLRASSMPTDPRTNTKCLGFRDPTWINQIENWIILHPELQKQKVSFLSFDCVFRFLLNSTSANPIWCVMFFWVPAHACWRKDREMRLFEILRKEWSEKAWEPVTRRMSK